jgi:hypothetical protein
VRRRFGSGATRAATDNRVLAEARASILLLRGLLAARGPDSKRSVVVNDSVATGLSFLVSVVEEGAFARTPGRATLQVAEFSHPDEREAGAASGARHSRSERVKPHWTLWRHFIPSPRTSGCMPGSISRRSTRCGGLGCRGHQGVRRTFGNGATRAATDNRLLAEARASFPLCRGPSGPHRNSNARQLGFHCIPLATPANTTSATRPNGMEGRSRHRVASVIWC